MSISDIHQTLHASCSQAPSLPADARGKVRAAARAIFTQAAAATTVDLSPAESMGMIVHGVDCLVAATAADANPNEASDMVALYAGAARAAVRSHIAGQAGLDVVGNGMRVGVQRLGSAVSSQQQSRSSSTATRGASMVMVRSPQHMLRSGSSSTRAAASTSSSLLDRDPLSLVSISTSHNTSTNTSNGDGSWRLASAMDVVAVTSDAKVVPFAAGDRRVISDVMSAFLYDRESGLSITEGVTTQLGALQEGRPVIPKSDNLGERYGTRAVLFLFFFRVFHKNKQGINPSSQFTKKGNPLLPDSPQSFFLSQRSCSSGTALAAIGLDAAALQRFQAAPHAII